MVKVGVSYVMVMVQNEGGAAYCPRLNDSAGLCVCVCAAGAQGKAQSEEIVKHIKA